MPFNLDDSTTLIPTTPKTQRSQSVNMRTFQSRPSMPSDSPSETGSLEPRPYLQREQIEQDPLKIALTDPSIPLISQSQIGTSQRFKADSAYLNDNVEGQGASMSSYTARIPAYSPAFAESTPETTGALTMAETYYAVIAFKAFRAETYQFNFAYGLDPRKGDLVVVEADRGMDLGVVVDYFKSLPAANNLRNTMQEKHQRTLIGFSRSAVAHAARDPKSFYPPPTPDAYSTSNNVASPKSPTPKVVRRLASMFEIMKLKDKEGLEAKAVRLAQNKARSHGLEMEFLDAEYQ